MWQKTFKKKYDDVSAETVWNVWSDVEKWHIWQDDIEPCRIAGPFAKGTTFTLTPKGDSAVTLELIEVTDGTSFTDCVQFWGAKMHDYHLVEKTDAGVVLTQTITVEGPLSFVWVWLVAQGLCSGLEKQNDALITRARELDKTA